MEPNEIEEIIITANDGYTPQPDIDYPSEETVFAFIRDSLPKKGKDYFTEKDIKDIVSSVLNLLPTKEELKGEDGKDGVVDYSTVKDIATPIIESKYRQIKSELKKIETDLYKTIRESKSPELTATQIRNKLESLSGNDRLSAKAIKGLEKFVGIVIAQSGGGGVDLSNYLQNSFETYSKNLKSYPYTIADTSSTVTTITYSTGSGTIIKTITEVSPAVTTIVFSGDYPAGLPTTKSITDGNPITITYS